MTDEEVLRVEDLHKSYGKDEVLRGVSFTLRRGESLVVMGPSGCGKSTLLRCINGLERIQGGHMYFAGEDLAGPGTDWVKTRQRIGMVFQSYDLFPHMSVMDNLLLAPVRSQKRPRDECAREAGLLLARVGLSDKRDAHPGRLSGGQKQRVAICRALMMKPEIMLLDEITAALDPEMVHEVLDVVLELSGEGVTMLIVTHEMRFARAAADRVLFLDQGEAVEETEPEAFFTAPSSERARQFLSRFEYSRRGRDSA